MLENTLQKQLNSLVLVMGFLELKVGCSICMVTFIKLVVWEEGPSSLGILDAVFFYLSQAIFENSKTTRARNQTMK